MANRGDARPLRARARKAIAAVRRYLDAARLRRGRDAGAPADLRRRAGAALHDPLTTRSTATSTCGSRTELYLKRLIVGGLEQRLRDRQGLPQRGRCRPSTTPSSRWSSGTRPTRTTRTRAPRGGGRRGRRAGGRLRRRARLLAAVASASRCATRSAETGIDVVAHRDRDALVAALGPARARPAGRGPSWPQLVDDLLSKYVEPGDHRPGVHRRLPRRALAVRQGPPQRAGPRRALRGLRRRHGDRQRLHRAQRPRRAARALRGPDAAGRRGRRRDAAVRRVVPRSRSSTACRRRAASA